MKVSTKPEQDNKADIHPILRLNINSYQFSHYPASSLVSTLRMTWLPRKHWKSKQRIRVAGVYFPNTRFKRSVVRLAGSSRIAASSMAR